MEFSLCLPLRGDCKSEVIPVSLSSINVQLAKQFERLSLPWFF